MSFYQSGFAQKSIYLVLDRNIFVSWHVFNILCLSSGDSDWSELAKDALWADRGLQVPGNSLILGARSFDES